MKKIVHLNIILLITLFQSIAQDIIVKINGDEIACKVLRVNSADVIYKKKDNIDGPEYSELKSNILFIKYENGQKDVFTQPSGSSETENVVFKPVKRYNSVFLEVGGCGILYSVNYERKFYSHKNFNFVAIKAGLGPAGVINTGNITATYNVGQGKNYLEAGGGIGVFTNEINNVNNRTYNNTNDSDTYAYFTPILGYRREAASGFQLRAFVTLLTIRTVNEKDVYYNNINGYTNNGISHPTYYNPFVGFSCGFTF